jgi:hypothetical protein
LILVAEADIDPQKAAVIKELEEQSSPLNVFADRECKKAA